MAKSMTVKQAGRKGGNATKRKWKNDKRFASSMRKKLSAAGKKGARKRHG
ncbi:hypothetical protein [Photobacterium salinisoli]|nr:hypothetical protein [Photobacterium salinisoli]